MQDLCQAEPTCNLLTYVTHERRCYLKDTAVPLTSQVDVMTVTTENKFCQIQFDEIKP